MATASNELITMQGAHSLTEILYPGVILYSRGTQMLCGAVLPLREHRCDPDLGTGVKCSFRVKGVAFAPGPGAPVVSSLLALISRCSAERGPDTRAGNEVCQLCSAASRSQCPAGLVFAVQLFQLLAPNSSKNPRGGCSKWSMAWMLLMGPFQLQIFCDSRT